MNVSDDFLTSILAIDHTYLNKDNLRKIKECLTDYLAAHAAGKRIVFDKLSSFYTNALVDGVDDCEITHYSQLSIENRVFISGITSHAAELDDGSRFGMIHPGAPLFSLLLPIAHKRAIPFSDFALAVLVGYEVSIRLAMAIAPGHYARGFHPTATCGSIGAAMGLAMLLNLSLDEFKNVLSAATVSASGTLKVIEDDSEIKPFNVGKAALNGLYAVRMGVSGFKGANDALGGSVGFLDMMTDHWDRDKLIRSTNDPLLIHSVYFKPYGACRHAHAPIEAALILIRREAIDPEFIEEINVYVYETIIGKHDGKLINGSTSAKMSLPYAVAVTTITGEAGMEHFEEPWVSDSKTQMLLKKVNIIPDDYFSSLVPAKRCARVEYVMRNGSRFGETVEFAKGEPENPMTSEDLFFKLKSNLETSNPISAEEVYATVINIEKDIELFYKTLESLEI